MKNNAAIGRFDAYRRDYSKVASVILGKPKSVCYFDCMKPNPHTIITNARIISLAPESEAGNPGPRCGAKAMRDLGVIANGSIAIGHDGTILEVGITIQSKAADRVIDANGKILMPGFVDCHTHTCWAGDRLDEFQMKLEGATYLSILKACGGIMSTVRATRNASLDNLTTLTLDRLKRMAALGTTTVEIKSGYGLNTDTELKMLQAITQASAQTTQTIIPTALIAHAVDQDQTHFFDITINETLPAVATQFPGITIDAYCEDGAWPLAETARLFRRATELGCKLRIHTDQFNSLGATRMAVEMGAISVDHLEATLPEDIALIAKSNTIPVALPVAGFETDDRYAPGRALIDAGAPLAIATNYNPGSAPGKSMPFAMVLGCRKCGLTPAEAITAATYNAACVVGLQNTIGSIQVGKVADLVLWDETDERTLIYELTAANPVEVFIKGIPI